MRPIHTLAAATLALCGIGLAISAEAAPKPGTQAAAQMAAGVATPAGELLAGDLVLVGHRDRDHRWQRDRDHRRHWRHERRGRDWDRHRDRDDRWRHGRYHRSERDRGRHYGWDRGRGHDKHWKNKHKRWHARRHPRHRYWHGRHVPRNRYVVIHDYRDYYLPRPPRGHFYARIDNDVFLVAAATRSIIDAFVLFDAVGRY